MKAELLVQSKALLGEGPIWDAENETLWWVDIDQGHVHQTSPDGSTDTMIDVGQPVGAVAAVKGCDRLLLALAEDGLVVYEAGSKQMTVLANPEADKPKNRFNDCKCDPAGRFWAGTMEIAEGKVGDKKGALYCLYEDLRIEVKLGDVTISNGLTWSPDKKTMYYIDTNAFGVFAFDYDVESGNIENQRVAFEVPEVEGLVDGMTVDEEGMLWIALWRGGAVGRWDPQTGRRIATVEVPVPHPTSCIFGGPSLDLLYITSARTELSEREYQKYPNAGSLFVYEPGIRGLPVSAFVGELPDG